MGRDLLAKQKRNVQQIVKYLKFGGNFVSRKGKFESPYGNINKKINENKNYDLNESIRVNKNGMYELQLNISDAVLKGSDNSI